jgi:hypothetical protein
MLERKKHVWHYRLPQLEEFRKGRRGTNRQWEES